MQDVQTETENEGQKRSDIDVEGQGVEEVVMATAMHGDITSKITKMFNRSEQYGNLAK